MKNTDEYFMGLALAEARKSLKRGGIPVGAVIVKNGRVVAKGRRSIHNKAFIDHAEMVALRDFFEKHKKSPSGLTMYTTLEPCVMCFGAVLQSIIGRLVYGLEDPYGGATKIEKKSLPLRNKFHYPVIHGGVLRKKSKEIMKKYLKITKSEFWLDKSNPLIKFLLR